MTALPELDGSESPKLLSIALSPQGHLHVDAPGDSEVAPFLREIAKHFARGDGHGVFRLGASQPEIILPAGLTFWRDVGRSFVSAPLNISQKWRRRESNPGPEELRSCRYVRIRRFGFRRRLCPPARRPDA